MSRPRAESTSSQRAAPGARDRADSVSSQRSNASQHSSASQKPGGPMLHGRRPDEGVSIGEDAVVTTNLLPIINTPRKFYQYDVKFRDTLPQMQNGNRRGRPVRRRDEMLQVFKVVQATTLRTVPFAVSHLCDKLWTLQEIPCLENGKLVLPDIDYTRKDGVAERLSELVIRHDKDIVFDAKIGHEQIYGTVTTPRDDKDVIAMLMAFASKYALFHANVVKVGSNRFFLMGNFQQLKVGIQAHSGYHLSVLAVRKGLGCRVNTTTTCFLQEVLVSVLLNTLKAADADYRLLSVMLRGLRVKVMLKRGISQRGTPAQRDMDALEFRVKTIKSVDQRLRDQRFYVNANDNVGQLVSDYLQTTYPAQVNSMQLDLGLPCINVGEDDRPVYYPPECLKILPSQQAHPKLQQLFTSDIISYAARNADVNRNRITQEGLPALGLSAPTQMLVQAFDGFQLASDLASVPGKILPPPKVSYDSAYTTKHMPRSIDASWNMNRATKFLSNGSVSVIPMIVLYKGNLEAQKKLASAWVNDSEGGLVKEMKRFGFAVTAGTFPFELVDTTNVNTCTQTLQGIFDKAKDKQVPAMLVLIPAISEWYGIIKRMGDMTNGVATSFVLATKMRKIQSQYTVNVLLKLNQRLGGTNHAFAADAMQKIGLKGSNVIVLGADVVHLAGPEGRAGCPSIAAVCGSRDEHFASFPASMRLQRPLQERIQDLGMMVAQRIRAWMSYLKNKGQTPDVVVMFRDGVSDSQYNNTTAVEMKGIQQGWESIAELREKPLKLVFIMVIKRHHTRFFPTPNKTLPKHIDERHGNNIKPDFYHDQVVAHPYRHDFYLQAHAALKGTGRPAHYVVLRNDLNLSSNSMATLVHTFHYGLGRATKGISYATPAFCADIALDYASRSWLLYGEDPKKPPPAPRQGEARDDYHDRCLVWTRQNNPRWNVANRPGPWHERLDNIMMWT